MPSLPSYKRIWQISWPLMAGMLAENLVGVIDTAFLGHVGEQELAASAIAGTFYIVLFVVGMGFGTGTQILIGRRNGEKNYGNIGGIFENSLYFVVIFSAITVVLSYLFSGKILGFILQSQSIVHASVRFLNIRVFTLFFSLGCVMMRSFFVGIQLTKYIGVGAFIVAGTNFVLDWILIFGHFGLPAMGLEGAALASVLAEVAGLIYYIGVTLWKIDLRKYNLFRFARPQLAIVSHTMKLSIFTMLQNLISLSTWFLFFVMIEKTGEKNLAASNIIRSYYILMLAPLWAFGASVSTLVSNAIGAQQRRYVYRIIQRIALFGLASSCLAFIPAVIAPRWIMQLYTSDAELIALGFKSFYVLSVAGVLSSVAWIIFSAISATGNTMMAMFIETFTLACYLASVYYFATTFPTRLEIIWCAENVYQIILGILSILYLRTGHWKRKEI